MNIPVEYQDLSGTITNQTYNLTRIAFAKHLAIAGQGYAPKPHKFIRTLSMFFHYIYYIQRQSFNSDKFSEPLMILSDPTEKGQFSNLAGKAIADFLSKKIDQSLFTVNYEGAMKSLNIKVKGGRPDLLAFKKDSMFAIEAKGFSGGAGNMTQHMNQSQTGKIPVNFSVACVSYKLYKNVKCKYHKICNNNVSYNNGLLRKLTQQYYGGFLGFLNETYFNYREIEIQSEKFYEVELSHESFKKLFPEKFTFISLDPLEIFKYYLPKLILTLKIRDYAKDGITSETEPFIFETNTENNLLYVDNDRIGLKIESTPKSKYLKLKI